MGTLNRKIPNKYKVLYIKALRGKSRKAAIRSFCLECVCYIEKEVINCTDKGCSLYPYRKRG